MYFWLLQNNLYPDLMRGVDKSLSDEAWKDFPKTIIVHGDEDDMAPYQVSLDAFRAIGEFSFLSCVYLALRDNEEMKLGEIQTVELT